MNTMIERCYKLWNPEEYNYSMACGFVPNIYSYIHDEDDTNRSCIIVVPGGGYCIVSPTEGEIVALEFYRKGYNVFVCTYTTNPLMSVPLKKQPMQDLSRAIRYIRKHAAKFNINPNRLALCGFSAGGHLCGSICVHCDDVRDPDPIYDKISNRPNAAVLSYPVITSGEKAHRDSFIALLGSDATKEELNYMSLEKHVDSKTPPCFIWQTAADELVPVENSFLFAKACQQNGVPYALHIFSEGPHGLSVSNADWASGNWGKNYTNLQTVKIIEKIQSGEISVPLRKKAELAGFNSDAQPSRKAYEEVAVWPELAGRWLKKVLHLQ